MLAGQALHPEVGRGYEEEKVGEDPEDCYRRRSLVCDLGNGRVEIWNEAYRCGLWRFCG